METAKQISNTCNATGGYRYDDDLQSLGECTNLCMNKSCGSYGCHM